MKFKKATPIGQIGNDSDYSPLMRNNVLVCFRVQADIPCEPLIHAIFAVLKAAFIANAATLAKAEGPHYVFLLGLLTKRAASSVRWNLKSVGVVDEFAAPDHRVVGFVPWGQVLPVRLGDVLERMLAADQDVRDCRRRSIAERMDQYPDGDFFFSDLTPDVYAQTKREMTRKPS